MKIAHDLDRDILAVQPFIFRELLVTRGKGELSGAAIKGIDPTLASGVLDLDKHMIAPDRVDSLLTPPCPAAAGDRPAASGPDRPKCLAWPPIILGKGLAHKLKAKVGDVVTLVMPLSSFDLATWRSSPPQTRRFTVTGIFYSGFDEYDRRLMYASLADTQELVGAGDQVLGIELKVKDVERAADIARRLAKALVNPQYQVQDWYELNQNLFTALKVQKVVLVVILTLIIIVAAVNMVSALTMMVTDKTREIAILKSMGASSSSVALVFQVVGLVIGLAGTIVGVLIGLGTCYVVGRYGYHLDPKVYLIDRLPIEVKPLEVLLVAGITMVISVISTLAPSRSAASLRPVDGLRYD